ncbi:MAG: Lsm family RNA-binding protein [Candidatus Geothermarchaeota archaeon]
MSTFHKELTNMINEEVIVELKGGKKVKGVLKALIPETLSLILGDVYINGEKYASIIYSGDTISAIYVPKVRVDLDELRDLLEKQFPRMVVYKRDQGTIIVMNKVKVTESGVEGEPGIVYDRVKKIYEEFIKSKKRL